MWRISDNVARVEQRLALAVTAFSTAIFTFLLCEGKPWLLFAKGGFTTDFYDVQARSFLKGKLDVPPEIAEIEGFVVEGATYLYYGPTLAILRFPSALFGSWADGRLTRFSMVIGFVLLCTITFHLTQRITRLIGMTLDSRWKSAVIVAAVAISPALYLAGWPSVYHETELWSLVFILATFTFLCDVLDDPNKKVVLLATGAAVASILTRVSVGLGAVSAVIIVGLFIWKKKRPLSLMMIGGALSGVAIHCALNFAKMGSLFDLPGDRQVLTLTNPERAIWFAGNNNSFFGVPFIPTTSFHYLRPDTIEFERLFPFIKFGPRADVFSSYPLESNTPSSSLTASATLLIVLAVIGLVVAFRKKLFVLLPLLIGSVVAAGPTLAIGFIANRYLIDLLPGLIVLAIVAVASVSIRKPLIFSGAVLLIGWGLWVNSSLAIWTIGAEKPGFTDFRYTLDEKVFGGAAPNVISIKEGELTPDDGVLGVLGDCDGLYIVSSDLWVRLELKDQKHFIEGTVIPSGETLLMSNDSERISLISSPDESTVTAVYQNNDGFELASGPIDWHGKELEVKVISDPWSEELLRGLSVSINGEQVLHDLFYTPSLDSMTVNEAFSLIPAKDQGVPICASLLKRGFS